MMQPASPSHRTDSTMEEWISLPATADILNALGGGHTFESALADIIDNSIDARASRVRIRFVVEHARLIAVQIRDDGTGMAKEPLVEALRLGGRREYSASDLGHFGIGLKAASMSQAKHLTVYSAVNGAEGLEVSAVSLDPEDSPDGKLGIRILSRRRAEIGYSHGYDSDPPESGTLVEWGEIRSASDAAEEETRQEWLDHRVNSTLAFLGLTFQRILEAGDLRIEIEIFDAVLFFAGAPRTVSPVDPFGYQLSGAAGYPRQFEGRILNGTPVSVICHILPPKGTDRGLTGKREDWQGLYVYRNDRLLTARPDWHGLTVPKSELRLARVEIDLVDELLPYLPPNPEKNGVELHPEYAAALQASSNSESGALFTDFLEKARLAWKESSKRSTDKPLTEIAEGLPPELLQQIGESFGWRSGHPPASIIWERFRGDEVFRLDLERRALLLNSKYAEDLGGEDSPLANATAVLLYLLIESNFTRSSHLRTTTREHLEQVDALLIAAMHPNAGSVGPEVTPFPAEALAKLRGALFETGTREPGTIPHPTDSNKIAAQVPPERQSAAAKQHEHPFPGIEASPPGTQDTPSDHSKTPALLRHDIESPAESALRRQEEVRIPLRESGPTDPLNAGDLAAFDAYCRGQSIGEIASALDRPRRDIVTSLALAVFGASAVADDESLAPFHGMPYTPDERERIISAYKLAGRDSIVEIARDNGRTPLAVAWLLLDSPRRPVLTDKRVKKNVRRRARHRE